MNLKSQVCSLELSKRLKELGVKQESLFFYNPKDGELRRGFECFINEEGKMKWFVSAFTVAELGEMLPEQCFTYRVGSSWFNANTFHDKFYKVPIGIAMPTEADARTEMLIYLKEHGEGK